MLQTATPSMLPLLLLVVLGLTSRVVHAAEPVFSFDAPTFFGSGCPAGSLEVITAADGQSVSMLFSQFAAATSGAATRERKSCNLAVPVTLKPGFSVGVYRVDYRGNAYVPSVRGAAVDFSASYFFAGATGPTYAKRWGPATDESILITNKLSVSAVVWSPCGAATTFRVNAAVTASKSSPRDADPQIAIDTTDVTVNDSMRFYVTYKTC
ncbi:hypothetical protein PINS_up006552 [Pythium insidiosum]|nr:hypothetical protein PINS_up006552 [Pythium insidiosum]